MWKNNGQNTRLSIPTSKRITGIREIGSIDSAQTKVRLQLRQAVFGAEHVLNQIPENDATYNNNDVREAEKQPILL